MDNSTKIYGLIGYPVKHSLSAAMHNAAFKHLGIDAEYRLFEVKPEELEDFLLKDKEFEDIEGNAVRAKDIAGFNVTIPHKVRAREILKREFPSVANQDSDYVKSIGAVNTVKRNGDRLEYRNTDAAGFRISLEKDLKFNPNGKKALIIGCGGAGRAVIAILLSMKINRVYVYDIYETNFKDERVETIKKDQIPAKIKECQLLVNATPIGMKEGDGSVIDTSLLHNGLSVYDVVYNRETELIKNAKALGLLAANGAEMLLYQGVFAFEFWTGEKAPVEVMRSALEDAIG